MSITPILMAIGNPGTAKADVSAAAAGFTDAVQTVQSGAPPGPEPPPGTNALTLPGEVGKTEPIAPFEELDLLATMKNLTDGFFDGTSVDAPMPSLGNCDKSQNTDGIDKKSDVHSMTLQLFMSAGAMTLGMMPATPMSDAEVNEIAELLKSQSSETAISPIDPTAASVAGPNKGDLVDIAGPIGLAGQDPIDKVYTDDDFATGPDALMAGPSKKSDLQDTKSDFFRDPMPMPAEPAPTGNPPRRSDYFQQDHKGDAPIDPKGVKKSDYNNPIPKPGEEIPPKKSDTLKSAHFHGNDSAKTMITGVDGNTVATQAESAAGVVAETTIQSDPKATKADQGATSKSEAMAAGIDGTTGSPKMMKSAAKSSFNNHGQDNPDASTKSDSVKTDLKAVAITGDNKSDFDAAVESIGGLTRSEAFKKTEDSDSDVKIDASVSVNGSTATQAAQNVTKADAKLDIQPLDKATTNHVISQVADRLEALSAAKPRNGVTIHLEPFELGKITLTVKSTGNEVDAHIVASHEAVRSALEHNSAHLQQALDQRGINLVNVNVSSNTLTQDMPDRQQNRANQNQQTQATTSWTQGDSSFAASTQVERRTYVAKAAGGVNLWI